MTKEKRKKRTCKIPALALSAVLAVTTCMTTPAAGQAAGTEDGGLRNPRVVMNYCDTIYFGSYLQEDTNGDGVVDGKDDKLPIRWRILWQNEDGTDAYVIADKILDNQPYNKEEEDVTWEACSLRQWLNDDFYKTAFTAEEQTAIIEQDLLNEDNEIYGTSGGNNTKDKVYLPSLSDMKNTSYGFSDVGGFRDQARMGKSTQYVEMLKASYGGWWWLRSPGNLTGSASDVHSSGYVSTIGSSVDYDNGGVRPALHINLSSPLVMEGEKMKVSLKSTEWDMVELGTYDGKPITWRVLSVSGQDVFLLSDQILTGKWYHDIKGEVTWEKSTLRSWLNADFYKNAFTAEEKERIIKYTYTNETPLHEQMEDTEEYVTLLSLSDIVNEEYGFPAEYLCGHPSRAGEYWLRSPGDSTLRASHVNYDGYVDTFGSSVDDLGGVRPALHFNLSSYPLTRKGTIRAETGVNNNLIACRELDNGSIEITKYMGYDTELEIPSQIDGKDVTGIGDCAFKGCSNLTSVTIPDGVTSIGNSAFLDCDCLESVDIPDSVIHIGSAAFSGCTNLKGITLPASLKTINGDAFEGMRNPDSETKFELTIPEEMEDVSGLGLENLEGLQNITIYVAEGSKAEIYLIQYITVNTYVSQRSPQPPMEVTTEPPAESKTDATTEPPTESKTETKTETPTEPTAEQKKAEVGKTYTVKGLKYKVASTQKVTFVGVSQKTVKTLKVPEKVTILEQSFQVTAVEKKAVKKCSKLTTVVIGSNVTTIGDEAFMQCGKLNKITIGKNVKTIGKKTFYGDKKLARIILKGSKITKIGKQSLREVPKKVKITAPKKALTKYKKLLNAAK